MLNIFKYKQRKRIDKYKEEYRNLPLKKRLWLVEFMASRSGGFFRNNYILEQTTAGKEVEEEEQEMRNKEK